MDECQVRPLFPAFDPRSTEAEERYDTVVRRLNRVRARRNLLVREFDRLSTQFAENDLKVESGPRRGAPLTTSGRRRRLGRLLELGCILDRLEAEERFAGEALDRMNVALDRWARETYGG